jgi:hypothetical protein
MLCGGLGQCVGVCQAVVVYGSPRNLVVPFGLSLSHMMLFLSHRHLLAASCQMVPHHTVSAMPGHTSTQQAPEEF